MSHSQEYSEEEEGNGTRHLMQKNMLKRVGDNSIMSYNDNSSINDQNSSPNGHYDQENNNEENKLDDELQKYRDCGKATVDRVKFYQDVMPSLMMNFKKQPYVNVEGPEFD